MALNKKIRCYFLFNTDIKTANKLLKNVSKFKYI